MTIAIKEDRRERITAAQLVQWITKHHGIQGYEKVFAYVETIEACTLAEVPLATWDLPESTLAGRVFTAAAEVRWQAEPGDLFSAWSIEEVTPGSEQSRAVVLPKETKKYYLIGLGTTTPGMFEESRYPGVAFRYPVHDQFGTDHAEARAFIEVREYRSPEADVTEIDALDAEGVMMLLNRPRLVGHRFVSVGVDKGGR